MNASASNIHKSEPVVWEFLRLKPAHFDSILRQVFILPVLALLLAAGALLWGIQETNRTARLIQRSDECISQATLTERLLADEESGLRGYQTTSDERFLQPLSDAEAPLNAGFDRLENLLAAYPDDPTDLDKLRQAHQAWLNGFARPLLAILKAGGEASDVNLNLLGKTRMDAIRAAVGTIIHDAEARRERAIARWHRQIRVILASILALALFLGVSIGLFTRRRMQDVSAAYSISQKALRRQAEELFASEQNLRTTLASIADGVITCDLEGRVQIMNDVAQELTGWPQHEAEGRPVTMVLHVLDERTRQSVESPAERIHRSDRPVESSGAGILVRRDGSEILIDHNDAPIGGRQGAMSGTVTVFRDVTIERKTQDALLANEKLAVAGRLAAVIAHEIHNPLDSVGNLLFLMSSGSTPEEQQQFLGLAQKELTRVIEITRAMLGLYRESTAPVAVDLREMVCDLLLLMESRFQTLGVTVTETLPAHLTIEGFPAELRQVFTNLITNAAEAAASQPNGAVNVSACSHARTSDGRSEPGALITVADNGSGIPPDVLEQLFHPFFTTKGEKGTGLGLWVSQGILRKHGGSIHLDSSIDDQTHGTVASVFLASKPVIQPLASGPARSAQ